MDAEVEQSEHGWGVGAASSDIGEYSEEGLLDTEEKMPDLVAEQVSSVCFVETDAVPS